MQSGALSLFSLTSFCSGSAGRTRRRCSLRVAALGPGTPRGSRMGEGGEASSGPAASALSGGGARALPRPPRPPFPHPSPTPFSTAPAVGKGAGVGGRKVLFYGKGRKEAEEKKKKGAETWPSAVGAAVQRAAPRQPVPARPVSGEPRRRRELALPAVTPRCRRRPWRPSPGAGAGADQAAVAAGASPPPCSAETDQARSRRFHAPGRGCARVALKEDRAAGECAGRGPLAEEPRVAPRPARASGPGGRWAGRDSEG